MDDLLRTSDVKPDSILERIDSAARQALVKRSLEPSPLSSRGSQRPLRSDHFDDRVSTKHLVQLMKIFDGPDGNGGGGLNIDQFKAAFCKVLGKSKEHSDRQLEVMHMKIDTNCDGTIDWDEFCTYMLLEFQERETMACEKKPPYPFRLKTYISPHRHGINRITILPTVSRCSPALETRASGPESSEGSIISISKDGLVCFWKNINNLKLYKTVNITKLEKKSRMRPLWVTDMVVLPNVHKILLAFTDSVLAIYDLATPNFERIFQITSLPHCVVTMNYWYDDNDYDHSVISLGDSGGGVYIMEFTRATRCLFGLYTGPKEECHRIPFPKLLHQKIDNMKTTYIPEVHNDWVSKVYYWHSIEGVLSCSSSDCVHSLVIINLSGQKESVFQVRKGINSFDASTEYNLIVTGGMDRNIRVWNPYVATKPSFELLGHNTSILYVAINDTTGQILSFSKDMEVRVWAIHNQRCLQICHQYQEIENIPCSFYFHSATSTLVTGYLQLGLLEGYREDLQNVIVTSHDHPLCAALYNSNFNQVVSGCHGSVVCVWDAETGQKCMKFSHCHGDMEITAMCFDPTGRRLITGGRDGTIKIWNFNNGACLTVLDSQYRAEITCFVFFQEIMIASGWCQVLAEYMSLNVQNPNDAIPTCWGKRVHKDDVLCMAYQEPGLLVTASYDGDIVLWDIPTQQVIAIVNATDIDFSGQYNKLYNKVVRKQPETYTAFEPSKSTRTRSTCSSSYKLKTNNAQSAHKARFGYSDNNAVEKVIFLTGREQNLLTATLIACGAGGLVQFWNIYGGGLLGEFNVFSYTNESMKEELHTLHSISACKAFSDSSILITGSTLGYIQIWDISDYCINVPDGFKPIKGMPPLQNIWKGHCGSIVSIDIAEEKALIVTASSDCCVSLWTLCGRYVGTFGEKHQWVLSYDSSDLPPRIPVRLQQVASVNTLQTIAPSLSGIDKTFSVFFMSLNDPTNLLTVEYLSNLMQEDGTDTISIEDILGEPCKRIRRHQPVKLKMRNSEYGLSVYSILKYSELQSESALSQPSAFSTEDKRTRKSDKTKPSMKVTPKKLITEKMLLPNITEQNR